MPNPENIIGKGNRFKKGESGNRNGRPRKYVSLLAAQGYKLSEVTDCIQAMMSMTLEELKGVWEAKEATVLEKTIASAIRKGIEKGTMDSMETLITRIYGRPKEHLDVTTGGKPINMGDWK